LNAPTLVGQLVRPRLFPVVDQDLAESRAINKGITEVGWNKGEMEQKRKSNLRIRARAVEPRTASYKCREHIL
jgi:hypothetical protein